MIEPSIPRIFALGFALLLGCSQASEDRSTPTQASNVSTPAAQTPVLLPAHAATAQKPIDPAPMPKFADGQRHFQEVKEALLKNYYSQEISEDDLYRAAIQGMLEHIDSRMQKWNKLLTPQELAGIRDDLKGEIVGIGVRLQCDGGTSYPEVLGLLARSPAEKAGIAAGDRILNVNGKLLQGASMNEAVGEIRGKVGQNATLTVLRGDKLLTFSVPREVVSYEEVDEFLLPQGIGYVRIRAFSAKTTPKLRSSLEQLDKDRARAIVLDLRGNKGGSFEVAKEAAELFLPEGKAIVTVKKRGQNRETIVSKGSPRLAQLPIAVIVDHATSSGAEILASALQEGRQAQLVGRRTFGKWSAQTMDELRNGFGIKYTMSLLMSGSGRSLDGVGLTPDVECHMEDRDVEQAQTILDPEKRLAADIQLRTAVGILRARL